MLRNAGAVDVVGIDISERMIELAREQEARQPLGIEYRVEDARAVAEGLTEKNGPLPVNPSGGLKAKGHPIGATGVSMHALTAMQLVGTAGDIQVRNASLGGIFNMGGTAVANYVSILERIK